MSLTDLIILAAACAVGWYFRAPLMAFIKKNFGSAE